jgi:hypothetical protein
MQEQNVGTITEFKYNGGSVDIISLSNIQSLNLLSQYFRRSYRSYIH